MSTAWLWAVAGLLLIVAEVLLPGVFLLWLGLAALAIAGVAALVPLSLEAQLGLYAVAAILSCVAGWLVYRKSAQGRRGAAAVNDPRARIVGSVGHVTEAIRHGQGKVRIGDGDWLAEGPDLAAGTAVRVKGLSGTTLKVEAL
jgi:membrane protein implicated in regulation of membrane protease activity